jgi:hypothetical protein
MNTKEIHKLQDNEILHNDYLNGVEDGETYNRGLGEYHEFQEIWASKKNSLHYLRGLIETVGFDPR